MKLKEFTWESFNDESTFNLSINGIEFGCIIFDGIEGYDWHCFSFSDRSRRIMPELTKGTSLMKAKAWVEQTVRAEINSLFEEEE